MRIQKGHLVINNIMKKLLLLVSLSVSLTLQANSQNLATKRAEESFINLLGQRLFSKLNTATLSNEPFKKLYYYSYQVFENDSICWFSYNDANKLIDSITKTAFVEAIDSIKKKGILMLLKNDAKTYIPLYVFYKTHYNDPYDDKVSIAPTDIVFSWGMDENLQPEPVYRITKPFIFRLPKSKPYYLNPFEK